ncbi:unnamed protein product [Chondrus crispus]|uniref:Reverse transcriptase Ty1/copia-type domain-containing protein n=1 Tax=Chondrus crispus TaxID=2769 RepID=R7QDV7_CHOCR|nr:unnamed protein product [Chondrus crispus]CDF35631.1 unnamed protein product [Chondrus crispus]|eukprot:XP_005715450.1 unnamed protein product [Chondrus crispus]
MQSLPLQRDVFTNPPPEANLPNDKILKIELPHYGLVEASSCFFDTYYPVFTKDLEMKSAPFDPCFLYKITKGTTTGITGLASDDSMNTGNADYEEAEAKATKGFITRKKVERKLRFLGFVIGRDETQICIYQDNHSSRLETLETVDHDRFRTIRGQLLFIAQSSRPAIAYSVAQLCQVQYKTKTQRDVNALNNTVKHLQATTKLKLQYNKLNKNKVRLLVFMDSGYNTNRDGTSQLGVIIFMADDKNNCHFLHWISSKCPRITRSMLASETYAFSMGYDYGVSLKLLFKKMNMDIPLFIFTDCKSIFDTITASKRLRELRLMNEIADIRRAYRVGEIDNVAWIRSKQNIADNLTRHNGNDILKKAMETGRIDFVIEQWVYKNTGNGLL